MELAILTTEPVTVHPVTMVTCATIHAPVDGMAQGVVLSVFVAMVLPAIIKQDNVDVPLAGQV